MFPYRRGNKKRGKGPGGRRHREGGRRTPSTAQELLPILQPTTKALAQMLAGHAKASGQLVHARNVLAQAERLIEERAVDRMSPAQREEFLEQVARLKLTVADADAAFAAEEAEEEAEAVAKPAALPPERLRELALSLATSTSQPALAAGHAAEAEGEVAIVPAVEAPAPESAVAAPEAIEEEVVAEPVSGKPSPRGARLRLKPYTPRTETRGDQPAKAGAN